MIDEDLGISAGSGARERPGFQQLFANVALGDVGIIHKVIDEGRIRRRQQSIQAPEKAKVFIVHVPIAVPGK